MDEQNNGFEERDASLDPDPDPKSMTEEELQESILEDSDMNAFQKFIARLDDKKWKLYQRIAGAVLGLLACVALFWKNGEEQGTFSYGLIIAMIIALIVPNILEKRALRNMGVMRITMAIAMGVAVLAYFLYWGFSSGFNFKA